MSRNPNICLLLRSVRRCQVYCHVVKYWAWYNKTVWFQNWANEFVSSHKYLKVDVCALSASRAMGAKSSKRFVHEKCG